jgi:hypothetical protein
MPSSEACAPATLVPLAEAVAIEFTEAWASVTLPLSAAVEQESPVPESASDWVPVQVTRAFAAGARLAIHNQTATTPIPGPVSLRQRIARAHIVQKSALTYRLQNLIASVREGP